MGQKVIRVDIGKNTRDNTVGIRFPEPTKELKMAAEVALEVARQLILTVREIQSERDGKRALDALIKDVTQ